MIPNVRVIPPSNAGDRFIANGLSDQVSERTRSGHNARRAARFISDDNDQKRKDGVKVPVIKVKS